MILPRPISIREPWVDALRALALLGVFIVNGMGYPSAPNYPMPLGAPIPVDSAAAIWINGFLAAFVQGKAYPLLCFLFGYSLCSIAIQTKVNVSVVKTRLKVRYKKLLCIGVFHGLFLYFGDVLTVYAVCGLIATKWVTYKLRHLLKIFRKFTIYVIILFVFIFLLDVFMWFDRVKGELTYIKDMMETMGNAHNFNAYWRLNATAFLTSMLNSIFMLPILLWLTLAGILVKRLRLLSSRKYSRTFWKKHLKNWQFIIALALNIFLGYIVIYIQSSNIGSLTKLAVLGIISMPISIWLIASTLALAMRYLHKVKNLPNWVYWLAPAGKHTLAMYLSLSLVLMLSGGAFLNVQVSTPVRLLVVISAWVGAVLLAKSATNRGFRDPIASWLSAKT